MNPVLTAVFGVGLIGLMWFAIDSTRIPGPIWYWSGHSRAGWWTAALACVLAMGIPALILAFVWRFGAARRSLRREMDELRESAHLRRSSRASSTGSVA